MDVNEIEPASNGESGFAAWELEGCMDAEPRTQMRLFLIFLAE